MLFTGSAFGIAASLGTMIFIYYLIKGSKKLCGKSILAGIILGIPNVYTLYYMLRALDVGMDGSVVFPLINVGVIVLSTVAGYLLFREPLSKQKLIAIGMAIISILLIAYEA